MDFERSYELFHQACELPPSEREAFLASAECDDETREQVLALLRADEDLSEPFLQEPLLVSALAADLGGALPEQIASYRVLRELGRGGMGIVYEAEQEQPRRRVALKVIRRALVDPQLLLRFSREAAVLGQLQHPGIAQIYEAGTATLDSEPIPYFAMEFVDGATLDAFVEAHPLELGATLSLFVGVCDAVQHAHERGVVHRDLKPSNILVTASESGPPRPKVLDFGIARLADDTGTLQTETGQVLGTLGYMSPEQLESRDVDARADVYALGVILYRLLSGQLPYPVRGKPLAEVARLVRDEEPTRLSSLNTAFRGDLDTIVTKALEKEPGRRYSTAAELAADVRRFLAHEPIVARAPTRWYRAVKFTRRNRALVGGVVATFVALLAGLAATGAALRAAQHERAVAEGVTRFLTETLEAADPEHAGGKVDLRDVLDEAARNMDARPVEEPEVEAQLRTTIGRTYWSLTDYPSSIAQLEAAVALWARIRGPLAPQTLETRLLLGVSLYDARRYEEAAATADAVLRARRRALDPDDPAIAAALALVGTVASAQGRFAEARAASEEGLRIFEKHPGVDRETVRELGNNLAMLDQREGNNAASAARLEGLVEEARRDPDVDAYTLTILIGNLANAYNATGRHDLAVPLLREAVEISTRVRGASNLTTLVAVNRLARSLASAGQHEEAERLLSEAIETARAERDEVPAFLELARGVVRAKAGRLDEAAELLRPVVARYEATLGPTADGTYFATWELLRVLIRAGAHGEAEAVARGLLPRVPPSAANRVAQIRGALADALAGQGRDAEAERWRTATSTTP